MVMTYFSLTWDGEREEFTLTNTSSYVLEEIMVYAVKDGTVFFPRFRVAWEGIPPGGSRSFTIPDEVRGHSLRSDFLVRLPALHERQEWPSPTGPEQDEE